MSNSLYDITKEMRKLDLMLDDDEQKVYAMQILQGELAHKVDSIVNYHMQQDDFIDAVDKKLEHLKELKKVAKNKKERFNNYLVQCMKGMGKNKIQGEVHSITLPRPRKKVEVDERKLGEEWVRIKKVIEPDKVKIKEALETGEVIDGAELVETKVSPRFK